MPLSIDLQVRGTPLTIELRAGQTTILVGANGSGKTKLAVECEEKLGEVAHRISAQRMLNIDPAIEKVSQKAAQNTLRFGSKDWENWGGIVPARMANRWKSNRSDSILNDAGALVQVLFAEQANVAVRDFNARADGHAVEETNTLMRKANEIWGRVLPTRSLNITADDIQVFALIDGAKGEPFSVNEMSDGEKAVFYMIGQALVAEPDSVLILDEPEIHVHRAILSRLWDELEAARPDCAFILITHDLEFASSRPGNKYVLKNYTPVDGWSIEPVPDNTGFSEELVTLILGSRKPILFVEGGESSLDTAFYRACYPNWTVLARGGCESVIHSVVTMRRNAELTRVTCAGLVDADGHDEADRERLSSMGVSVLPVSEIENLLLLPSVSRAILETNHLEGEELDMKLSLLKAAIFKDASDTANVTEVVLSYCRRRIDRMLKQIDFSAAKSIDDLASSYLTRSSELDVRELADGLEKKIAAAIANEDLAELLAVYDRKKPLLSLAASHLKNWKVDVFAGWIPRAVRSPTDDKIRAAIQAELPAISPA